MNSPSQDAVLDAVPDGRPYVHQKCGEATTISGSDFRSICNPFELVGGTMCVQCNDFRPLREFAWVDTGEAIDQYRARVRAMFPGHGLKRRLIGLGSIVGGTVLGTFAGVPFASMRSIAAPAIGCLVGFVLGTVVAVRDRVKHQVDGRRYR